MPRYIDSQLARQIDILYICQTPDYTKTASSPLLLYCWPVWIVQEYTISYNVHVRPFISFILFRIDFIFVFISKKESFFYTLWNVDLSCDVILINPILLEIKKNLTPPYNPKQPPLVKSCKAPTLANAANDLRDTHTLTHT